MDNTRALEIINALATGIDPLTGEIFAPDSTLQHPDIVRALFVAAIALGAAASKRGTTPSGHSEPPPKAGAPWSDSEDRELVTAFDKGTPEKELATIHQRSKGAIRARLIRFGRIEARLPEPVG